MANAHIPKHDFSSPGCDGENLTENYCPIGDVFRCDLNWSVRFWVLSAILAFSFCTQGRAAEKIQGVAVYEVFSSSGKRLVKVEESFQAIVEGKQWLIETRLLSLDPPSNSDQVFCPPPNRRQGRTVRIVFI